jgi:hypothetical protein
MKKNSAIFIAVLSILFILNSCKKNGDNDPDKPVASSMTFTSNSIALSFNTCVALTAVVDRANQLVISGYNTAGGIISNNSLDIDIMQDIGAITVGQTFPVSTIFGQAGSSAMVFLPNGKDQFCTQPGNPQGIVTITAVKTNTISGTFSAKLFKTSDFDGDTVRYTIANGTFVAKKGLNL